MLGGRIASFQPPSTCLPELRRALLDEWCNIPQDQIDNLILSMPRRSPHQVSLQPIIFCTFQSIAELPTGSPKMVSTWLYRQHFAMFLLNHHYKSLGSAIVLNTLNAKFFTLTRVKTKQSGYNVVTGLKINQRYMCLSMNFGTTSATRPTVMNFGMHVSFDELKSGKKGLYGTRLLWGELGAPAAY
ncbi:uncharacterized protein TNCV_2707981 [Trichonephila clavipes]|nr:uncharacterized protein TNCV_2707981 [Trichonephila clavipes]